jgi:eukaryotic-like serine/threonine-protein kinase
MVLAPGSKLGPYEIVAPLGAGGMGEVYCAKDIRLSRTVAIKILPRHMASNQEARVRFDREAKALSSLQHPNICTVYDIGSQDGIDFLVMEYLEGETLQDRLVRGPLPLDLLTRYGMEIADAVDAAHRKGVVHRDLKPSNIVLTRHGEAKVLDFGLAKLKEDTGSDLPTVVSPANLTSPGTTVGTVAYMSPEQAKGDKLDERTDIFALGAVLYEMVTAKPAFGGKTSALIFRAILDTTPEPPSKFNPEAPPRLEEIIFKALEKDRDVRYQSAAEIRAELKRLRRDSEGGKTTSDRVIAAEARPKYGKSAAAVGVLIAVILFVWALSRQNRTSHPEVESIAVLPFVNNSASADSDYLSDGLTESLIDSLTRVPQLKVKARNSVFRYKGKEVDVQKIGGELGVSAMLTGRVLQRGDNVEVSAELTDVRDNTQIWGERYNRKAADLIALQQQIASDIADKLRSKLTGEEKQRVIRQGTDNAEAYELYLKGRYYWNRRTGNDLRTAVSYFNQAIGKDPQYAMAYSGMAAAYTVMTSYGGEPNDVYPKARAAAQRALALDPNLASAHVVLADYKFYHDWDFAGAEDEYRKAFALDPNDATAHQWHAEKRSFLLDPEEKVVGELKLAHDLDPLSLIIRDVTGDVYVNYRNYDRAIETCSQVVRDDPEFAKAHECLAWAYRGKRMHAQAIEEYKAFGRLSGNELDIEFASALEGGFRSSGWNGALLKAASVLTEMRKKTYVPPYTIAELYADAGNKEEAFRWLNIALDERDDSLVTLLKGDYTVDSLRSDSRFADLLRKTGLQP